MRFLLIVGTKFDLRSCCCSDWGGQIFMSHVFKIRESWQSPKVCWALVPQRIEIGSHCRAKDWTSWRKCGKFGTEQKSIGWNVTHTKMQEQTGLNWANEQRENWEQRKRVRSRVLW
jgi:hypothetical protein